LFAPWFAMMQWCSESHWVSLEVRSSTLQSLPIRFRRLHPPPSFTWVASEKLSPVAQTRNYGFQRVDQLPGHFWCLSVWREPNSEIRCMLKEPELITRQDELPLYFSCSHQNL
jgi:hypothetical protein